MKYVSEDRLGDFEFHDSEFKFVEWERIGNIESLILSVELLNVHRDAAPNKTGVDMEIKEAVIRFGNIKINEFELMRNITTDENGIEYYDEPQVVHKGKAAREMFENELDDTITVLYLVENENGEYELGGIGSNFFMVRFVFNTVEISWDDYSKAAWYELNKQHIGKITLMTPSGDVACDAHIISQSEDAYVVGNWVRITLNYEGRDFQVIGEDYFWVDAFAKLQNNLPENVRLKCCLNCRHGNMCPYGNRPGEVFCTNGAIINDKDDMIHYIDDNPGWQKRSRFYTDVCEDFVEQSDDYYTYNDYLYRLKEITK